MAAHEIHKESKCKSLVSSFNRIENSKELLKQTANLRSDEKYMKNLAKIFHTAYAPSKITPRNDYYNYINYSWITNAEKLATKNKEYYAQIDSFRTVQDKVYYQLIDIVKEYTKTVHTERSKEIKNVYESFLHGNIKITKDHCKEAIQIIDKYIHQDNLLKFLAYLNSNEMVAWAAPISWAMSPDLKNSKIYRNQIFQPTLTAYDYVLYIDDPGADKKTREYQKLFKKKYMEFMNRLFTECLGENHGLHAQDVWDIEMEMLTEMGCNSVKNESEEFYNKVTKEEALSKYNFDWATFSHYLGFEKTPDFFICNNLSYLKCIMPVLNKDWKTKKWRTYYIFLYLRQISRCDNKLRSNFYDFFGKFMQGLPAEMPNDIYPIWGLAVCFNTFLTNEYIKRNKKQEYTDYVNKIAADLLAVFKRQVTQNTWLSPSTKKQALLKLDNFKFIIGSPPILREDPLLGYTSNDAWGNLLKIAKWRFHRFIKLEGKEKIDIPVIDWSYFKLIGSQAYIVNAYYTPSENSIYIPLGYLQKPFIDLDERGIEYNLAHIGYTIGHEMSHSLDNTGSKYDYKGNLNDWWTKEDKAHFNRIVANVNKQYETFAAYDGIKMDASLSAGENLADISGLSIVSEYLRDFQMYNDDINPIRALSFQAFFVYIAIQARQVIYKQAIQSQLKINPHPMNKYRANCPLARMILFQSLYNIKKGDKMYWSETGPIW